MITEGTSSIVEVSAATQLSSVSGSWRCPPPGRITMSGMRRWVKPSSSAVWAKSRIAGEVVLQLADGERDADAQAVEVCRAHARPARSLISPASEKSYSVMPPASCVLRATPTRL